MVAPHLPWFDILGVPPDCSVQAANAARSRLAKKYHPDLGGSKEAMQRINAALDTAKRLRG